MPAASVFAIIYGLIATRTFTPSFIFDFNFLTGAVLIGISFAFLLHPSGVKSDKLTDHSTLIERHYNKNISKREKAYIFLFAGILVILITGLIQLLLALVVNP